MGSNAELFAVLAEHGGQRGHHELGKIRDGVLLFFGGMALLPLEVGKKYKVYAKQDGSWKQLSTETIGSYLAFDLPGNTAELAVVPGSSVPAWVIVTAAAAVVLAGGTVLIRRRKKAPVKQAEE